MIPKIIHYCWFGGGKKSEIFDLCLQSWKTYLPDFKIIEWNENNFTIDCPFAADAYIAKRFAFVSDYARFKVLWEHGGIYLDTDMLFLNVIDDEMLKQTFFTGAQSKSIVSAGIIASTKKNEIIQSFVDTYQSLNFSSHPQTSPYYLTMYFNEKGEQDFSQKITTDNYTIYSPEYFYAFPFPIPKGKTYHDFIHPHSIVVHLWEGTWLVAENYFNIGNCKKGIEKLKEEKVKLLRIKIWYWTIFCRIKNMMRPIYHFFVKR